MDTTTLLLGIVLGLLLLLITGIGRPSDPLPTFVVMPAMPESNTGCGTTLLMALLIPAALMALADLLGLLIIF